MVEMKKLIFVRHGRAEKDTSGIPDFERSLTLDGKNSSEEMAMILNEKIQTPVILITSPAFRAFETAMIFARILGYDPDKVILRNNLYHPATLNSFAEVIGHQDNNIDTIILFGHNPSFTEIPDRLSKNGCHFLPKCGIVCLSFKTEKWEGIVRERGSIEYFLKPQKKV